MERRKEGLGKLASALKKGNRLDQVVLPVATVETHVHWGR